MLQKINDIYLINHKTRHLKHNFIIFKTNKFICEYCNIFCYLAYNAYSLHPTYYFSGTADFTIYNSNIYDWYTLPKCDDFIIQNIIE